ncbi:hypothetical protein VKT23_015225 [Stygiomarasmius scandens]|uniref:Uncharacterized protein n=1 Tax=Marasmiellus scandens TaxID=2682957 RepID=A0ABR1IYC0_9AGAR
MSSNKSSLKKLVPVLNSNNFAFENYLKSTKRIRYINGKAKRPLTVSYLSTEYYLADLNSDDSENAPELIPVLDSEQQRMTIRIFMQNGCHELPLFFYLPLHPLINKPYQNLIAG